MLAIGRALMSRPKLILFDEPSLGLAPNIVERMFEIIRTICDGGTTVLMVEQNAFAALELCDHAYLLESGVIATGQRVPTSSATRTYKRPISAANPSQFSGRKVDRPGTALPSTRLY